MNPSRTELANAIRALSMDAVQRANNGHPGMPMGMADIAEVLWNDFVRHNPKNPEWANRDRVVLSNGHGSMLIYSVLHLTGYDLSLQDLKDFRLFGSKTPGHPEYGMTPGVETTTGPLGQGVANAVGMALAEKILAESFNRPNYDVVDHNTYVLLGDGCLMEGISHEACSLAGVFKLGKLIALYDDNGISIDGSVDGWFADDTPKRFESYGWHVIADVDGHDSDALNKAIAEAKAVTDKPSIICAKTVIGFGSPNKAGTAGSHGSPLGDDEIALARKELGWEHAPFDVPDAIMNAWDATSAGASAEAQWNELFASYSKEYPELAAEFNRRMAGELPANWASEVAGYIAKSHADGQNVASRKASGNTLDVIGPVVPELFGGSADLTGSNLTKWAGCKMSTADDLADSNYMCYGVREFAMSAMMNGLSVHGGFIPYAGTFLVFSDYARNAVRLSALMKIQAIYVYSHDSIGLGADGPTHQPIEHLASLRVMPNLYVWRPCDDVETAVSWQAAVDSRTAPSCLVLSRQTLAHQNRSAESLANVEKGGYVLSTDGDSVDVLLLASGSEVELIVKAADELRQSGKTVQVVSMPCLDKFDEQDAAYQSAVLPSAKAVVAVEAGSVDSWYKYVGTTGKIIGMTTFGESAPGNELFEHFGFTVDNIVKTANSML